MDSRASYYRVNVGGRISGKLLHEKAFTTESSCLFLDVTNKRPFLNYAISRDGGRVISGDQVGHLYLFDLETTSFKLVHRLASCVTALAFVDCPNETGINLVACTAQYKTIHFLRLEVGGQCSEVASFVNVHKSTVSFISVQGKNLITCSTFDRAILWDLDRLSIAKQLCDDRLLKAIFVADQFLVASYKAYKVYVFDNTTLEVLKIIEDTLLVSVSDEKIFLRDLTSDLINVYEPTSNSSCPELRVRVIKSSSSLKSVQWLSDGMFVGLDEAGKLLASGETGVKQKRRTEINSSAKIASFELSDYILVALTMSGGLQVFDLRTLNREANETKIMADNLILKRVLDEKANEFKAIELSRDLLSRYGHFPHKYRFYIWSKVMGLPLDREAYSTIKATADRAESNPELFKALASAEATFRVADLKLKLAMQKTLRQLCVWDSDLIVATTAGWLPVLVFPFVKLLPRNGMFRFELVALLLVGGLCKWTESRLTNLRTLLAQESPRLVEHFAKNRISESVCFKSLIESAFSDVFYKDDWLVLMDHLLSNGLEFADALAVAYTSVSREAIIAQGPGRDEVVSFFNSQNNVAVSKVLRTAKKIFDGHIKTKRMPLSTTSCNSRRSVYTSRSKK